MNKLEQVAEKVLAHPFHQAYELTLAHCAEGVAEVRFPVNGFTGNPQGALHGGILYAMMDVASFFAVSSRLAENQHAVSIEVHTSVLRAALPGESVHITSRVDRLGRTLAAMRCEAHATSPEGKRRLVATGSVTKSIITDSDSSSTGA